MIVYSLLLNIMIDIEAVEAKQMLQYSDSHDHIHISICFYHIELNFELGTSFFLISFLPHKR